MQYLLMIYEDEKSWAALSEAEAKEVFDGYAGFTRELKASGKWLAGDALQPVATATTVRVRGGRTTTTDGPFAETKEQLGGYYLIEAADLDEALAWAVKIPTARTGSIEIRPIPSYAMDGTT